MKYKTYSRKYFIRKHTWKEFLNSNSLAEGIYSKLEKSKFSLGQVNSLINEQKQKINSFNGFERLITFCSFLVTFISMISSLISTYYTMTIANYLSTLSPEKKKNMLETLSQSDLILTVKNILQFFQHKSDVYDYICILIVILLVLWWHKRTLNKQLDTLYSYQRYLQSKNKSQKFVSEHWQEVYINRNSLVD